MNYLCMRLKVAFPKKEVNLGLNKDYYITTHWFSDTIRLMRNELQTLEHIYLLNSTSENRTILD